MVSLKLIGSLKNNPRLLGAFYIIIGEFYLILLFDLSLILFKGSEGNFFDYLYKIFFPQLLIPAIVNLLRAIIQYNTGKSAAKGIERRIIIFDMIYALFFVLNCLILISSLILWSIRQNLTSLYNTAKFLLYFMEISSIIQIFIGLIANYMRNSLPDGAIGKESINRTIYITSFLAIPLLGLLFIFLEHYIVTYNLVAVGIGPQDFTLFSEDFFKWIYSGVSFGGIFIIIPGILAVILLAHVIGYFKLGVYYIGGGKHED